MRTREFLHEVMSLAWQFVKRNGYTMSEAMKVAWANLKLKGEMRRKMVPSRLTMILNAKNSDASKKLIRCQSHKRYGYECLHD